MNISLILDLQCGTSQANYSSAIFKHELFAKAVSSKARHSDITTAIASLFNYGDSKFPAARLGACAEGLAFDQGWWLKADPVQLLVDAGQIYLIGNEYLDIQTAEIELLLRDLRNYFCDSEINFFAPRGNEWYIQSKKPLEINTFELSQVKTKDIREFLPTGPQQKFWRLALTEIQMLLFNHVVNNDRQLSLRPMINSVWFWGEGELVSKRMSANSWQKMWGSSSLHHGLAKYYDLPCLSPSHFEDCLENMNITGDYLIVLDEIFSDTNHSLQTTTLLEKNWFSPLLNALKSRSISSLRIFVPGMMDYVITSSRFHSWWKKLTHFRRKN